jgi:hypothetical protein
MGALVNTVMNHEAHKMLGGSSSYLAAPQEGACPHEVDLTPVSSFSISTTMSEVLKFERIAILC